MNRIIVGPHALVKNDFIGPLGSSYVFHIFSAEPKEIPNYLAVIAPFDGYTWAFVVASVISAFLALVAIDIAFSNWTKTSRRRILHQSDQTHSLKHTRISDTKVYFLQVSLLLSEQS